MNKERQTVLMISSDPAFSRTVTAHWPQDTAGLFPAPEFIVLDEGFFRDLKSSAYDLAIADASFRHGKKRKNHRDGEQANEDKSIETLKRSIVEAGKPAIVVGLDGKSGNCKQDFVIELSQEAENWPTIVGLLGQEILRRRHAEERAREAESVSATSEAEATLGRYMVEMRTNVNNALTTVLGNAELLALEAGLPANVRAQADTIRNMALRLHEVFQRFSSIEKELNVAAREAGKKAMAASAGR